MTDDAKTPLAVVDEEVDRVTLHHLNLCCGIYVAQALEAGLVVYMADRLFHKFSAQGMTGYHPAYSMTYCARKRSGVALLGPSRHATAVG